MTFNKYGLAKSQGRYFSVPSVGKWVKLTGAKDQIKYAYIFDDL